MGKPNPRGNQKGNPSKKVPVTRNEFFALNKLERVMYAKPFTERDVNPLLGFLRKIRELYPKGGN